MEGIHEQIYFIFPAIPARENADGCRYALYEQSVCPGWRPVAYEGTGRAGLHTIRGVDRMLTPKSMPRDSGELVAFALRTRRRRSHSGVGGDSYHCALLNAAGERRFLRTGRDGRGAHPVHRGRLSTEGD
jgi:hypothetical protein